MKLKSLPYGLLFAASIGGTTYSLTVNNPAGVLESSCSAFFLYLLLESLLRLKKEEKM